MPRDARDRRKPPSSTPDWRRVTPSRDCTPPALRHRFSPAASTLTWHPLGHGAPTSSAQRAAGRPLRPHFQGKGKCCWGGWPPPYATRRRGSRAGACDSAAEQRSAGSVRGGAWPRATQGRASTCVRAPACQSLPHARHCPLAPRGHARPLRPAASRFAPQTNPAGAAARPLRPSAAAAARQSLSSRRAVANLGFLKCSRTTRAPPARSGTAAARQAGTGIELPRRGEPAALRAARGAPPRVAGRRLPPRSQQAEQPRLPRAPRSQRIPSPRAPRLRSVARPPFWPLEALRCARGAHCPRLVTYVVLVLELLRQRRDHALPALRAGRAEVRLALLPPRRGHVRGVLHGAGETRGKAAVWRGWRLKKAKIASKSLRTCPLLIVTGLLSRQSRAQRSRCGARRPARAEGRTGREQCLT